MTINDEVLQKELACNFNNKMKNIVATIQKEQNQIIRNEKSDILVIQGVAGSGKTSIALHRVAYFLYRYKGNIKAQNIVIFSPNKVFSDYISDVLPELGEEPIIQLTMEDVARDFFGEEYKLETLTLQTEKVLRQEDQGYNERVRFKSSMEFLEKIKKYIDEVDNKNFEPKDYRFGEYVIPKEYIKRCFLQRRKMAVDGRIKEIADDIIEKLQAMDIGQGKSPSRSEVIKKLYSMFNITQPMELYKEFYKHMGKPEYFIYNNSGVLEYSDIFPLMYIYSYFNEVKVDRDIKHVLIDEMQDYTPIQYAVLNNIYPCNKTILGDIGQKVVWYNLMNKEDFKTLYPSMDFVKLNKSYRSTLEIIEFAKGITNNKDIEVIPRHGPKPMVIKCKDKNDEIHKVIEEIEKFKAGENSSLGIICKTNSLANDLYNILSNDTSIYLLEEGSVKFQTGVTICSVFMAKGLEFDEVIVVDADSKVYGEEFDRNLLYVACTRAMHKLTLIYSESISKFLTNNEK